MAEAEAWVMIPKMDKDKTGCVIDMRPLVLCKDCRYGYPLSADYVSCGMSEENEFGCHVSHKPVWFCADGERR